MKHLCTYLIILYSLLLAVSCGDDKVVDPASVTPPNPWETINETAERTVIVYLAAQNSLSPFVQSDIKEMEQAAADIPSDVNFVIYLDGTAVPVIYHLSAKYGLRTCKTYEQERNSTDSLTMLETLRDIEQHFPARHYALSLWSHASGWTPRHNTFGQDQKVTSNPKEPTEMEIPELSGVLRQLPKLDYIFFDACFMQCIEAAYELRDVTHYMVGSPAEIPGPGAPYHLIVKAMCNGDAEGIVNGYLQDYQVSPEEVSGAEYKGVLLSCIDCSQLEELVTLTGSLLTPYYMDHKDQPTTGFQYYCSKIANHPHFYDMRTTMRRLLSDDDYARWMEAFDRAVPYRVLSDSHQWTSYNLCSPTTVADADCYGGVSMFVPVDPERDWWRFSNYETWNRDFQTTAWYKAAGWEATGW